MNRFVAFVEGYIKELLKLNCQLTKK